MRAYPILDAIYELQYPFRAQMNAALLRVVVTHGAVMSSRAAVQRSYRSQGVDWRTEDDGHCVSHDMILRLRSADTRVAEEEALLRIAEDIPASRFSLVVYSAESDLSTRLHELAHGLFRERAQYRDGARAIVDDTPTSLCFGVLGLLHRYAYPEGLWGDELQAYVLANLDMLAASGVHTPPLYDMHDRLAGLFHEVSGFRVLRQGDWIRLLE